MSWLVFISNMENDGWKKIRLLTCLLLIICLPQSESSICETLTIKGYVPESWNLVNTQITRTCGADEKVILPMEPPEENPSCSNCRNILILKQIQGTSIPPSAFEHYNRTTILHLEDLGIDSILPGAFESLEDLEKLYLSGNKLSGIGIGVLSSVENLRILDLSANRIHFMKQVSLEGTKQMSTVNLSSNILTNIETSEAWTNVSHLDLSHNLILNVDLKVLPNNLTVLNISSNHLTSFNVRKNFSVLELQDNSLKTFDFSWINYTMKVVNLRKNQITQIFGNYCRIKEIDLSNNQLNSVPCDCSNNSPQVEYLNLAHNQISYVMPQTISELTNLRILHLEENQIKTVKSGTFSSLQNLKYLNISHNAIENFEFGSIDNIKNVEDFDVSYNKLKQLKRYIMHTFANLKHLHLEYNNISFINATNLNEDLPKIWDINIIGNNLSCHNLWDIMRIFNKRPVHFPAGPYKNVSNVHGMPCYFPGNTTEDDYGASMGELDVNKGIADYFNHDYRESNFYKFLEGLRNSNFLVFNETRKVKEEVQNMMHHHKPEHFAGNNSGSLNGYLITVVLFLLAITSFIALQAYVLYNKFRIRNNDAERLL